MSGVSNDRHGSSKASFRHNLIPPRIYARDVITAIILLLATTTEA